MTKANNDYYIPKNYTETPLLTAEEETRLARLIQTGTPMQAKRAKDRFVLANIRLVMKEAAKGKNYGLPYNELVQEGTLGLMHALSKYDPERGWRFSTYATPWIRQYMQRATQNQADMIRIPIHQHVNRAKLAEVESNFLIDNEREATLSELAEITGMSESTIKELRGYTRQPVSLNIPTDDENSTEFGNLIADPNAVNPEEAAEANDLKNETRKLLSSLSELEAEVLALHVGFSRNGEAENENMAHEAIALQLGITKERVRYIIRRALAKLRHPVHTAKLRG